MGCISGTTTSREISQTHDGEADPPYKYTNPPELHTTSVAVAEISAAAPESPIPPLSNNVLSSNDTAMLEYIGIVLPPKPLSIIDSMHNESNTTTTTKVSKPRKLSITALQNRFRAATSNKSTKQIHAHIKQTKYGTTEIYKSSPEQSEIKEQEASNSADLDPSKRSKSKETKHRSKPLRNYKFSSSDTASILDINNEDSSSYEFESITKLTAFTNLAPVDTANTEVVSENDTVIENDTIMAMSPIPSHLSTNASIVSQASTNRTSLKLNQTSFKPNVILPSSSKYKGIENPFYHSEDGQDADEDEDIDEDAKSDSSYYNNYSWYQSFKPHSVPKALAYSHSNKVFHAKTSKHFVPHSVGDKVKMGASYPFTSPSKRSIASSYNSMRAQGSSSVSHDINRRDYNPFRQKPSVHPPHLSSEDTADSDGTISTPPPYPHNEYYNVTFGTRRCPPPHAYNHYSHSLDNGNQSDMSTHV